MAFNPRNFQAPGMSQVMGNANQRSSIAGIPVPPALGGGMTPPFLGGTGPGYNPGNGEDPTAAFAGAKDMMSGLGDVMTGWMDKSGLTTKKAEDSIKEIGTLAGQQGAAIGGVNAQMDKAGNKYVAGLKQDTGTYIDQSGAATQGYQTNQQNLSNAATQSGKNLAGQFDTQNAAMGTLQNQSMANAGQAMSLADAGNVNNKVQTDTRNLYNSEGQNRRSAYNQEGDTQEQAYEQKAQGIGRQGLADTGVLAALGGQAMAGQLGGAAPMTGGQLAAMQGANMGRAGMAYGRAQQQMQSMRDQGMNRKMDQRNQGLSAETAARGRGLEQGFNQSDAQYNRGQQAVGTAAGIVGQRSGMQNDYQGMQQSLRGEESGYGGNIYNAGMTQAGNTFGAQQSLLGATLGNAQDQGARQIAQIQGTYQPQMAAQGQLAGIQGAYTSGMMGMMGDLANAGAYAFGQTARGAGDAVPL